MYFEPLCIVCVLLCTVNKKTVKDGEFLHRVVHGTRITELCNVAQYHNQINLLLCMCVGGFRRLPSWFILMMISLQATHKLVCNDIEVSSMPFTVMCH